MIDPAVRAHISSVLADIARSEGARILYAAESGSRAWGFGSPDSDYDVRFVYAHPPSWYLQLNDERDVIERPLDDQFVDLGGWDVRKALRLGLKSNPVLYEWLCSPIVYADDCAFGPAARALFERHASRDRVAYHYHSIARKQWRSEIEDRERVKLKKYFYIIRPLLSLDWVARFDGPPPMALNPLIEAALLSAGTRGVIEALRIKKRDMPEMGLEPRIPALDDWALSELARLDPAGLDLPKTGQPGFEAEADALFQRAIGFAP